MSQIKIYTAAYSELDNNTFLKLAQFRYKIFIKRLKWNIPNTDHYSQLETDQYDTKDAFYTIAEEANGRILGCSRLIPTNKPYLLSEQFNFLCVNELPRAFETWEVSRFAGESQYNDKLPIEIFKHSLSYAWSRGAKTIVAVTTIEMERYFQRKKILTKRMGVPTIKNGDNLVALEFIKLYQDESSFIIPLHSYFHEPILSSDMQGTHEVRSSP